MPTVPLKMKVCETALGQLRPFAIDCTEVADLVLFASLPNINNRAVPG